MEEMQMFRFNARSVEPRWLVVRLGWLAAPALGRKRDGQSTKKKPANLTDQCAAVSYASKEIAKLVQCGEWGLLSREDKIDKRSSLRAEFHDNEKEWKERRLVVRVWLPFGVILMDCYVLCPVCLCASIKSSGREEGLLTETSTLASFHGLRIG